MKADSKKQYSKDVHVTVAIFYVLKGAETSFHKLKIQKQLSGGRAGAIIEKDLRGDVNVREVGPTAKKGAASGAVLGGALGLLTGGTTLALAALGGALGGATGKRRRDASLTSNVVDQVSSALVPGASAILIAGKPELPQAALDSLKASAAEVFNTVLVQDEVNPANLLQPATGEGDLAERMQASIGERAAGQVPYKRIHVVINPVSGKDQPMLNIINRAFRPYDIAWEVSITQKYGDATEFARRAIEAGYDLVAGYGGDGTQHEIANALIGSSVAMGVLPGGTGNGFANEVGVPKSLAEAAEVLCTSHKLRKTDVVQLDDGYFIQRLYIGIEPEQQTSRAMKDKYGVLAYGITAFQRRRAQKQVSYRITIDGKVIELPANKVYVVNAAQTGSGIAVTGKFSRSDDGLLEVFVLDLKNLETISAAADRMLKLSTDMAEQFIWQGKEITIETDPDQPVWTDGEYYGRTPVTMKVIPGGLNVVVPEADS